MKTRVVIVDGGNYGIADESVLSRINRYTNIVSITPVITNYGVRYILLLNDDTHPVNKIVRDDIAGKFELIDFTKVKEDDKEKIKKIFKDYDYTKFISLPTRSTAGSAGYDFKAPADINIPFKSEVLIPTFVRAKINPSWFLQLVPRSGLGFKYGLKLTNTVGVIDSDYYDNPSNGGHIWAKMSNPSDENILIKAGDAFMQGIFVHYGIVSDDAASGTRTGGFGSTTKS